jgi:phosphodiesterase/alkaline phosphatase D-like protein
MPAVRAAIAGLLFCLALGNPGWAQAPPGSIRVLAGPIAQNVTDTSATIWWETDQPAPTIVTFGTSPDRLTDVAQQPWGDLNHSVQLSSLRPNTTYYFQLQRSSGEVLQSGQFQTQPSGLQDNQPVRIVDGPRIEFLAQDHAVIVWTTNVPSSAVVKYGASPNSLTQTAQQPWGQTTHRVTINGLQKNGTYYFTVESSQAPNGGGAVAQSQPGMFQTYVEAPGLRISSQR